MPDIIQRANGWIRIAAVAVPLFIGGLVGYGKLQANVEAEAMARKDSYQTILRELDQMHQQLDRIEAQRATARP